MTHCARLVQDDLDHAPLTVGGRRGRSRMDRRLVVAMAREASPRALIIEGAAITAQTLQMVLSVESFIVEAARTAAEGIALARANDYDLILLGTELPDMSVPDALGELREAALRAKLFNVSVATTGAWEPPTLRITASPPAG